MIWKYLWAWLIGLVFLYAQLLIMPAFELGNAIPNILVPWMIYLIWSRPRDLALVIGSLIGVMYDITQPSLFGLSPFTFLIFGMAIAEFRKPFEAESKVARMLTLLLANLIFYLVQWLVLGVSYGFTPQLATMNLIAFVYNLAISFVVFWSLQLLSRMRLVIVSE